MSSLERWVIWWLSFLAFLVTLFIAYRVSYKLGIKKALYRTTYILLSIMFAFILAPMFNNHFFNLNLQDLNIELKYRGNSYFTLVDYIEEVIVHNEFLNDIYIYFPSLKDLFMDFPEVILAPVTYVLLFMVFIILWMPLYLYLSYKRKRRILYDRHPKKSHRVWAGVIGCAQWLFLVSILLTPVNGFNRIYHVAIEENLDDEYTTLCNEIDSLSKYSKYCDFIELYDSTIFATIGGKDSLNSYVFDSLTRIYYDGGYTNISKESSLIMKSSILLDQSGLFEELIMSGGVVDENWILNNNLDIDDISIIVDTLRESKYSKNLLNELGEISIDTLNGLLSDFLEIDAFKINMSLTNDDFVNEIKTVLKIIDLLKSTGLLSQIMQGKDLVMNFIENTQDFDVNDIVVFDFVTELVNCLDLDSFILFVETLFESKIFKDAIPYLIDKFLGEFGFDFVAYEGDVLKIFKYFADFGKLVKKYQPYGFFDLIVRFSDEELEHFAYLFESVLKHDESRGFMDFVFGSAFVDFKIYSVQDIYSIKDFKKEVFVFRDFSKVMHGYRLSGKFNFKELYDLFKNSDSELCKIILDIIEGNLAEFVKKFLAGEKAL